MHASTQLWQDHDLEIAVFEEKRGVGLVYFLVENTFDDGVGVNRAAAALIHTVFKENGVLVRRPDFVCWDDNFFGPSLNGHD